MLIKVEYTTKDFMALLHDVRVFGDMVSVRGKCTREMRPALITVAPRDARNRIHWHRGRWQNTAFCYAELLFMLQGEDMMDKFVWYAPEMANYADEGASFFHGAYGPRLGMSKWPMEVEENLPWNDPYRFKSPRRYKARRFLPDEPENAIPQIEEVESFKDGQEIIDESDCGSGYDGWRNFCTLNQMYSVYMKLKADRFTRQAIMTIWKPDVDNDPHNDIPCTIALHFLIRDGKLDCNVFMRSQDIMTGFQYDLVHFRLFQEMLAGWLGVDTGFYSHFVSSLHLYEFDFDRVSAMQNHMYEPDLHDFYQESSAMLDYNIWLNVIDLISMIESCSRIGSIEEAHTYLKDLEKYLMDKKATPFWADFARNLFCINAGKWGHTHVSITEAMKIAGPTQVPVLARCFTYHNQRGGEDMMDSLKNVKAINFYRSIEQYMQEKTGKLQMAPGVV